MSGDRHPRIWTTSTPGRYVGDAHPDAVLLAAGIADKLPDDFDEAAFEATFEQFGQPEDTPPEDTPAEETPAEEPAEDTPPEDTPAEETPAEETPAEEPAKSSRRK